jgi:hypothetical protein
VFSIRIGSGKPPLSWAYANVLRQFSKPASYLAAPVHVAAVDDEPLRPDVRSGFGVLEQELAAGNPDPVIGRRDVEPVGRVDVDLEIRGADRVLVRMWASVPRSSADQ